MGVEKAFRQGSSLLDYVEVIKDELIVYTGKEKEAFILPLHT